MSNTTTNNNNDYEFLGVDSQMPLPPAAAPRAPSDAPSALKTSLPHTPALKADDDVDLESNRPSNHNVSFSDGVVNPKRSHPSVMSSRTRSKSSSESDEEERGKKQKTSTEKQKGGTFCWIFACIGIFLAVIALLGLATFFLFNVGEDTDPRPINGTMNETTTAGAPYAEFLNATTELLSTTSSSSSTTFAGSISRSGSTIPEKLTTTTVTSDDVDQSTLRNNSTVSDAETTTTEEVPSTNTTIPNVATTTEEPLDTTSEASEASTTSEATSSEDPLDVFWPEGAPEESSTSPFNSSSFTNLEFHTSLLPGGASSNDTALAEN